MFGGHLPAVTSGAASIDPVVDSWCHIKKKDDVDATRVDVGHQTGSPAPKSCQLTFSSKLFSSVDYSCEQTPVAF